MNKKWKGTISVREYNTMTIIYGTTKKKEDSRQIHLDSVFPCWGKLGGFLEL